VTSTSGMLYVLIFFASKQGADRALACANNILRVALVL
jgi:hypothetical protein